MRIIQCELAGDVVLRDRLIHEKATHPSDESRAALRKDLQMIVAGDDALHRGFAWARIKQIN